MKFYVAVEADDMADVLWQDFEGNYFANTRQKVIQRKAHETSQHPAGTGLLRVGTTEFEPATLLPSRQKVYRRPATQTSGDTAFSRTIGDRRFEVIFTE